MRQAPRSSVEITIAGPTPRTVTIPIEGPYLTIFTKRFYSRTEVQSEGPRAILPDVAKATADELRAVWGPFVGEAGTYELNGNMMIVRPLVSKNPTAIRPSAVIFYTYKLDTALWLTQLRNQDKPVPTRLQPVATFKLVRVE